MDMKFNSWPVFSDDEIQAVSDVLRSGKVNYWTGDMGRKFESEFKEFVGCSHAIALTNGTLALELSFRALGIGKGDEVIVTSRTFLASISSIIMVGAKPVFVDVDLNSQNISIKHIQDKISPNTKVILAVHLAGWPCDMDAIMDLAERYKLKVVEDCAQAHGAKYKGRSVGSIGHIGTWSFCQDKIMSTGGEGGMVTTNDTSLWHKMWSFKDHGKSWRSVYETEHPAGFRWLHESFGSNYRMTEMQAAIGCMQLLKMSKWQEERRQNAQMILEACDEFSTALRVPRPSKDFVHAWYKCYVFVKPEGLKSGWTRDKLMAEINKQSVPCYSGSCSEVYLEKAFDGMRLRPEERLSVAKELGETALMFLVDPSLGSKEIKMTVNVIRNVFNSASLEL